MDMDIEYFFDTLATLHRSMLTMELPNFLVRKTKETKEQAAEWSPAQGPRRSQQAMAAGWTV